MNVEMEALKLMAADAALRSPAAKAAFATMLAAAEAAIMEAGLVAGIHPKHMAVLAAKRAAEKAVPFTTWINFPGLVLRVVNWATNGWPRV